MVSFCIIVPLHAMNVQVTCFYTRVTLKHRAVHCTGLLDIIQIAYRDGDDDGILCQMVFLKKRAISHAEYPVATLSLCKPDD